MIRLGSLTILVLSAMLACSPAPLEQAAPEEAPVEATPITDPRQIHDAVLTLDSHIDIPFTYATDEVDPGVRGEYQVDIPKMLEGGLDAGFFIVYVGQGERTPQGNAFAREQAMIKFDAIHRMTDEMYPDRIELAYTADDVERIASAGKLVAAIGIENGWVIGRDIGLVETYFDRGARYMTLAHSAHNDIADSATPNAALGDAESEHDGISEFGEQVVASMNRVGMMVDVSHISKAAMLDAVRLSEAPVIASHSSVSALTDVPRNMDDEQLLALAESGGVIQIVAFPGYVSSAPETASVEDLVDHIDYAVELIGIEHVGISSDFDGGGGVEGWSDASETFNVTRELVRRGYTMGEIAMLWSGNLLRVWRENERVAREIAAGETP